MGREEYFRELDRILTGMGRRFANARRGFHEHPVSGPEFFVMRNLSYRGSLSISDLASGMALNQSTVSNVVNSLDEKGLVEKHKDPADRRVTLVRVTGEGKQILKRVVEKRFEHMKRVFSPLSDEDLQHLIRIFSKVHEGFDASAHGASRPPE